MTCISDQDLRLFAVGNLPKGAKEKRVLGHLLACNSCLGRIRELLKARAKILGRGGRSRRPEQVRVRKRSAVRLRDVWRLAIQVRGILHAVDQDGHESEHEVSTRDLSIDGGYFLSGRLVYPGEQIRIDLFWPVRAQAAVVLKVSGVVRRADVIDRTTFGFAVKFQD